MQASQLQGVLDQHKELFQPGFETLKGFEAKIYVDPGAKPRFFKAFPLLYALRETVECEMECLVQEGTITPVQYADGVAPIMPVQKSNSKLVRICGDFHVAVNQVSKLNTINIQYRSLMTP